MYRKQLPQICSSDLFLTDGGIETFLIFKKGLELPLFAAFPCLDTEIGRSYIKEYYTNYAKVALEHKTGFILESATWRASQAWANKLDIKDEDLTKLTLESISVMLEIRKMIQQESSLPIVLSGCLGPRGDGYSIGSSKMTSQEAEDYHSKQISIFAQQTEADLVTAFTINYVEEAIGIVKAADKYGILVVISFTVETDGKLPSGLSLMEAILAVDKETDCYAAYYMINCAHPSHFSIHFEGDCENSDSSWHKRIRGLRPNSSELSHQELDELETLDEGNPNELGLLISGLRSRHKSHVNVFGGCCGTNVKHVQAMAKSIIGDLNN